MVWVIVFVIVFVVVFVRGQFRPTVPHQPGGCTPTRWGFAGPRWIQLLNPRRLRQSLADVVDVDPFGKGGFDGIAEELAENG